MPLLRSDIASRFAATFLWLAVRSIRPCLYTLGQQQIFHKMSGTRIFWFEPLKLDSLPLNLHECQGFAQFVCSKDLVKATPPPRSNMARLVRLLGLGFSLWAAGSAWCALRSARSSVSSVSPVALRAATPNFGDLLGSMGKVSEAMKKMPDTHLKSENK